MTTPNTAPAETSFLAECDRFWFQPRDPATLSMIRLFTGLILLYVHFCWSFPLMDFVHPQRAWIDEEMYRAMRTETRMFAPADEWNSPSPGPILGPDGQPLLGPDGQPVPDPYFAKYRLAFGRYMWSVYFHVHDDVWIWTIHIAFFAILVLFTVGLWTPITTVLAWIITLQYIHRAPTMLFGMDTMIVIGLFYLMLGPGGSRYSLDHWLAQRRERKRRNDPNYVLPVPPSTMANVSIRLIQIHFCVIYFAAGTSKLLGSSWWNGTALWNCVANFEFAPFYLSFYEPSLRMLTQSRPLWELAMTGSVVFTLVLELGFPFLVWVPRIRWVCVLAAVMLHTGIGMLMGLITFSLMMLVLVSSFIPSEVVIRVADQLFRRAPAAGSTARAASDKRTPELQGASR